MWIFIYLTTLIWSAINPKDRFTWFLEVAPALVGGALLLLTARSFKLTPLLYGLILIHCVILMVGGHFTYAEVPYGDMFSNLFGSTRNNFDKLGHFAQGFVPAILAREILVRKSVVAGAVWLNFIVVSFCLAFSAFYELVEWLVAISTGESAEAFLGTQGYVWDTQTDMALALLGAIISVVTLASLHNVQIQNLKNRFLDL